MKAAVIIGVFILLGFIVHGLLIRNTTEEPTGPIASSPGATSEEAKPNLASFVPHIAYTLRNLSMAQSTFRKRQWYPLLNAKCYSNGVADLYEINETNETKRPSLLNKYLVDAFKGIPTYGYLFYDLSVNSAGKPVTRGDPGAGGALITGFTYLAKPAEYGKTGLHVLVINENGLVYGKDLGSKAATEAFNRYPDLKTESGWLAMGN